VRRYQIALLAIGMLLLGFVLGYGFFDMTEGRKISAANRDPHVHAEGARAGENTRENQARQEINEAMKRIQADPGDLDALLIIATRFQILQRYGEAIRFYARAAEVDPDNPDTLTDMGTCFRGTGEFDRALELFREAQGIDPAHWQSLYNIAVVLGIDQGRYDEAMETLDRVEQIPGGTGKTASLRHAIEQARAESAGEGSR
jgi:tetratricopeptide (TPR) repeat protein